MNLTEDIIPAMTLAPSAHNSQPWNFTVGEDHIDVFADWSRHLTASDPTERQLYLSLGCAIANGIIAAAKQGMSTQVTHFPEGEGKDQPAARLVITKGVSVQADAMLFDAIGQRRTDRSEYDTKQLTDAEKAALPTSGNSNILFIEDKSIIEQIAKLTGEGSYLTLARKDFKEELSHWVRHNWTKQPDGMPGYAMGIPAPLSLLMPMIVKVAPIHKQEQASTDKQLRNSSAVAVFASAGNTKSDWLIAGANLQRLWLEAVTAGLAAAPLAAAIEAGDDIRQRLRETLQTNLQPHAILRLGHEEATR